jgi:hypothetical protein
MTKNSKNMLLISGSGRNVGKTTFMREVIARNVGQQPIAVKITPHFHEPTPGLIPIQANENFRVFRETDTTSAKDSSQFVQAGAEKVFYIQTTDEFLGEAFEILSGQLSPDQPVVVESAALRKFIIPGLYIFIEKNPEDMKPFAREMKKLADATLLSNGGHFSISPENVIFNQSWKIQSA